MAKCKLTISHAFFIARVFFVWTVRTMHILKSQKLLARPDQERSSDNWIQNWFHQRSNIWIPAFAGFIEHCGVVNLCTFYINKYQIISVRQAFFRAKMWKADSSNIYLIEWDIFCGVRVLPGKCVRFTVMRLITRTATSTNEWEFKITNWALNQRIKHDILAHISFLSTWISTNTFQFWFSKTLTHGKRFWFVIVRPQLTVRTAVGCWCYEISGVLSIETIVFWLEQSWIFVRSF